MKHVAFGLTDIGRVRKNNEDCILLDDELGVYLVCDGMGGHAAGEVASHTTCYEVVNFLKENFNFIRTYRDIPTVDNRVQALHLCEAAIQFACRKVYELALADVSKKGMGTTCVLLIVAGENCLLAHVGDSRAYLSRMGQTYQLTEDHSFAAEGLRKGIISPDEVTKSYYRSVVTRTVGFQETVQVDTLSFEIMPGDTFLLCSDGLSEYMEEENFQEITDVTLLSQVPEKLVALANNRGGKDNISCIVAQIDGATDTTAFNAARKIESLRKIPLFRQLQYLDLIKLLNILQVQSYQAGDYIIREGQESDNLYILIAGAVEVAKQGKSLARLEPGFFFGEMGLIDQSPRSADVMALEPSQMLSIPHKDFRNMMKLEYRMSLKVLWAFCEVLSNRLRITSQEMVDLLGKPDGTAGSEPIA